MRNKGPAFISWNIKLMPVSNTADVTICDSLECRRYEARTLTISTGRFVPNTSPRSILVKFATYRARQEAFMLKLKLKEYGHNKVFFNEVLTNTRAILLLHARGLAKSGRVEGAWSPDGSVLLSSP
ncbi:hypothetical protein MAR_021757, partial [Mya arenaria]